MSFWGMIYVGIGLMVFVSCFPWDSLPKNPKDRFVQCFTPVLAGALWPVPVLMSIAILAFVVGTLLVSLLSDRRR